MTFLLLENMQYVDEKDMAKRQEKFGKNEVSTYYYYYYHHHHHNYHYSRIFHFSALAGKNSPILGCGNQQD